MRCRALVPFGVEIDAFQIADAGPGDTDGLIDRIARHRVAVFRGQQADDQALVRFLALLGELTFTQGETPTASP